MVSMMSTPAQAPHIARQPPPGSLLSKFNLKLTSSDPAQLNSIPQVFKDAMSVREKVFVNEQKAVPLKFHMDSDDARSWHWVLYVELKPAGTIRLVPGPHYPHPEPGARFVAPTEDVDIELGGAEERFSAPCPEFRADRMTDLHDGFEPYVKLGRLCVVEECRGRRYADLLIQAALNWAQQNWAALVEEQGGRQWQGLVCVHAGEIAVNTWKRNGFVVDEGMASWFEGVGERNRHVGMFLRIGDEEDME